VHFEGGEGIEKDLSTNSKAPAICMRITAIPGKQHRTNNDHA
jgi:hypothetical protein